MQTTISNRIIRKLNPCYDPSEVVEDENEELPAKEWVAKYRDRVKSKEDIIWLLCNKIFMSDKDMRLFAVWCAREALKLVKNPDYRNIAACDASEKYANGEITGEELDAARNAARDATWSTAWNAAWNAARDAARDAAWGAAWSAARNAARDASWSTAWDAQINRLLTYFN